MNEEIRSKLAAYLDGALPEGEARALEAELKGSPELRAELDAQRALSRRLRELPREPLPPGFLQRLRRRQEAEAAGDGARDWVFLAPAYRPFAAALSSLIIALVVWDRFAERTPVLMPHEGAAVSLQALPSQYELADKVSRMPSAPPSSEPVAGAAAPEFFPPAVQLQEDERRAAIVARRERARAKGEPLADAGGDASDAAPVAPAAPPVTARAARSLAGVRGAASARAVDEEARSARNEELRRGLESEKKRMGIAAFVTPNAAERNARRVLGAAGIAEPAKVAAGKPVLLEPRDGSTPGAALRSAEELRRSWAALRLSGPPPAVDFEASMAVLLPEPGELLSAEEGASGLRVSWRPAPALGQGRRFVIVPRSSLPVRLIKK